MTINTLALNGTVGAGVQLADDPLLTGGGVSATNRPVYVADAGIDGIAIDLIQDTACYVGPDLGSGQTGDIFMVVYAKPKFNNFALILQALDTTNANAAQVRFSSTRQVQIRNNTTAAGTTATVVPIDEWCRIEWKINRGAGTQLLNLYTGTNLYGTTPTETISGAFTGGNAAGVKRLYLGNAGAAVNGRLLLDRFSWSTVSFAPPYGTPPPPIQSNFKVVIGGSEVPAVAVNVIQSGAEVPAKAFSVT